MIEINNLCFLLRKVEKGKQIKSKVSRTEEIIKIKAESMNLKQEINREKINETKSWFMKKISKSDELLSGQQGMKERRYKLLISEVKEGI